MDAKAFVVMSGMKFDDSCTSVVTVCLSRLAADAKVRALKAACQPTDLVNQFWVVATALEG